MELIVVISTILLSNYFLVDIGLGQGGDGMCLMMCAAMMVVCGDVAVVWTNVLLLHPLTS